MRGRTIPTAYASRSRTARAGKAHRAVGASD
jgi:hypothetical protein